MKARAKTAVYYNKKRYEKDEELIIKEDAFDDNLFENLDGDKKEPKETKKKEAPAKNDVEDETLEEE